jgi:2-hydroxy-3-keto-5-methylthiopentenyl-1-phosphate phosphatase
MAHSLKIFCDFDGTVAVDDVGERFFQTFGNDDIPKIVEELYAGKITPRECYHKEFAVLRGLTVTSCEEFVGKQAIDPHFREFAEFCRERRIDLWIVSDGFDFYIKRILDRYGLAHIPFIANHLVVSDTVDRNTGELQVEPQFPYTDGECECCANCKRNHLLNLSGEDDIIIYVGDGISDRCPVRYADIVFAKGRLIHYCQEENITYFEYSTFRRVLDRVREIAVRKRLKKRREAAMHRRNVFMQG